MSSETISVDPSEVASPAHSSGLDLRRMKDRLRHVGQRKIALGTLVPYHLVNLRLRKMRTYGLIEIRGGSKASSGDIVVVEYYDGKEASIPVKQWSSGRTLEAPVAFVHTRFQRERADDSMEVICVKVEGTRGTEVPFAAGPKQLVSRMGPQGLLTEWDKKNNDEGAEVVLLPCNTVAACWGSETLSLQRSRVAEYVALGQAQRAGAAGPSYIVVLLHQEAPPRRPSAEADGRVDMIQLFFPPAGWTPSYEVQIPLVRRRDLFTTEQFEGFLELLAERWGVHVDNRDDPQLRLFEPDDLDAVMEQLEVELMRKFRDNENEDDQQDDAHESESDDDLMSSVHQNGSAHGD